MGSRLSATTANAGLLKRDGLFLLSSLLSPLGIATANGFRRDEIISLR